jgi:hypothetical protein
MTVTTVEGTTPLRQGWPAVSTKLFEPGRYLLVFRARGYRPVEQTIFLTPGRVRTVELELAPE